MPESVLPPATEPAADSSLPNVWQTPEALQTQTAQWLSQGLTIGLVPTMGALHNGHMALVAAAAQACDRVVVSIFVNPKQFSAGEDLDRYPATLPQDRTLLARFPQVSIYAPTVSAMYPQGYQTTVSVGPDLSGVLCGATRAGHFAGVATVVTKLFLQSQAHVAYFGEKDYQQLLIVKRLVQDLNIPLRIAAVPTQRAEDGLALSSRNLYLSAEQRATATHLPQVMQQTVAAIQKSPDQWQSLCASAKDRLHRAGFVKVAYLELRHQETLALPEPGSLAAIQDYRLFVSATLGTTRLIDNYALQPNAC